MTSIYSSGVSRRGFIGGTLATVGALAAGGTMLSGCSSSSSSSKSGGKVVVWHTYTQQSRVDFMAKLGKEFEAAHPGTSVSIEVVPSPEFATKWPAAKAAGTLPDVTTLVVEQGLAMWTAGALHPMDDVLSAVGGESAFLPNLLRKQSIYKGHPVMLPHYVHDRILVQRADLLDAAGVTLPEAPTWDDALTAAQKLTKAPSQFGWILKLSPADVGGGYLLYALTRSTGGKFFDSDGKSMLNTPEVKRAVEYMVELGKTASSPGQLNYNINDDFNLLYSGKTAMGEDSGAAIGNAVQQSPDVAKHLTSTYLPRDTAPANLVGGFSVALPKGKNPTMGREVAKFLYARENYVPFLHTIPLFMFPALKSPETTTSFNANPTVAAYPQVSRQTLAGVAAGDAEGFDDGPSPYAAPTFSSHIIENMFGSIFANNTSVSSALSDANKKLQSTLDDVRSRLH
jgi:multiple sugar transport system substrate-binding protein